MRELRPSRAIFVAVLFCGLAVKGAETAPTAPKLYQVQKADTANTVVLRWSRVEGAIRYHVILVDNKPGAYPWSERRDTTIINDSAWTDTTRRVAVVVDTAIIGLHKCKWAVRARDSLEWGPYDSISTFDVRVPAPVLNDSVMPVLASPRDREVILLGETVGQLYTRLRWHGVPGATRYHLKVRRVAPGAETTLVDREISWNQIESNPYWYLYYLKVGRYLWNVKAGDSTRWTSPSETWSFDFDLQPPRSPELLSPPQGTEYMGPMRTVLKWNRKSRYAEYERYRLEKLTPETTLVAEGESSQTQVTVGYLQWDHSYRWTAASCIQQVCGAYQEPQKFRIRPPTSMTPILSGTRWTYQFTYTDSWEPRDTGGPRKIIEKTTLTAEIRDMRVSGDSTYFSAWQKASGAYAIEEVKRYLLRPPRNAQELFYDSAGNWKRALYFGRGKRWANFEFLFRPTQWELGLPRGVSRGAGAIVQLDFAMECSNRCDNEVFPGAYSGRLIEGFGLTKWIGYESASSPIGHHLQSDYILTSFNGVQFDSSAFKPAQLPNPVRRKFPAEAMRGRGWDKYLSAFPDWTSATVHDLHGRRILELRPGASITEKSLPSGLVFLRIFDRKGMHVLKLVR